MLRASLLASSLFLTLTLLGCGGSTNSGGGAAPEPGSFALAPSVATLSLTQGSGATDTIAVTDASPFAGSVTFSVSGLPSGVTATFGTNPASASSLVTFAASASATVGTATVTVSGASGALNASTSIALTVTAASIPLTGPFSWSSSGPLISAVAPMVAVKDASAVYFNNEYQVYASSVDPSGSYNLEYLHFADFAHAGAAQPYYLNTQQAFNGYHTAPQVFYFTPQKKWYLIYQSPQPQFSTNSDLTQPQNWTAPQDLLVEPSGSTWLDYWIICDSANCYMFFSGDNGKFYRSSTTIQNFPGGFSSPLVVMSDPNQSNLFEASNVYKVKGMDMYLADIECIGSTGERFFRSFTAPTLDGNWTPLNGADSEATPFLGIDNVTFASGVTPWTTDFSSGGLIPGYDETAEIDPANLQFLFQGDNKGNYPPGTTYGAIPWQLGLATRTIK